MCLWYLKKVLCFPILNFEVPTLIKQVMISTQDQEEDQLHFFKELYTDVESNLDKKLIIGGDFNLCLKTIDNSNNFLKKSKARTEVIQMMETYGLLDIWRLHHPDTRRFSWRRSNPITQRRLDYWLIGAEMCYDISPNLILNHLLKLIIV